MQVDVGHATRLEIVAAVTVARSLRLAASARRCQPPRAAPDRCTASGMGPEDIRLVLGGIHAAAKEGEHRLFGFLTTEANAKVGAVYPAGMPVLLHTAKAMRCARPPAGRSRQLAPPGAGWCFTDSGSRREWGQLMDLPQSAACRKNR